MAQKNSNLHAAKSAKNDEFYTQLTDIEKELKHYKQHFKDKVVFCNCDDPTWSEFWRYFHINFSHLGLKKLISTHYDKDNPTYKLEYTGGDDNNIDVGAKTPLMQNGDFRSPECVELLKEADIVVSNPPFSLFRSYVSQLMEHNKKFLIIGNKNAITYKEVFPLLKENKVWIGYGSPSEFNTPYGSTKKVQGLCRWFTNLDIAKRSEKLVLRKRYSPIEYPMYDNYDAINVDKVSDIPVDYYGIMGVPITFLDNWNPNQFTILGCTANPESNDVQKKEKSDRAIELIKSGKLKGAKCVGGNSNIYIDQDDFVRVIYHRLLIRRIDVGI